MDILPCRFAASVNNYSESSSITVLGIKELLPKLHNRPLPFYTHTDSTYEWSAHRFNVVLGYIYYVYCRRERQYFLNEHHFPHHKNFFWHPPSLPNEKNNKLPPPPHPLPCLLRKEITGNVAASGSKILKQLKLKVVVQRNGTGFGTEAITNRTI